MSTSSLSAVPPLTPIWRYRTIGPSYSPARHNDDLLGSNIEISSLCFAEFSARDEKGFFKTIPLRHLKSMLRYLGDQYGVVDITQMGVYLEMRCKSVLPEPAVRPFTVAGCLAVWLLKESRIPSEILPQHFGQGEYIMIDDELAADLDFYQLPKVDTLLGLRRYFPDAEYVSYMCMAVIIELPQLSALEHRRRLHRLPAKFENAEASLQYHNGPMTRTMMKRLKVLNRADFHEQSDNIEDAKT